MDNRVFLNNDGCVEEIYQRESSEESVKRGVDEIAKLLAQLRREGKPALVLIDFSKLEVSTADSRKTSVEALQRIDYDKVAIFGANTYMTYLANWVIAAVGKGSKVRLFKTREKAIQWLKESWTRID